MSERGGCEELAGVAAELALGVLTGRERADALAHLEGCDECRERVRQLTATGEGLLGLLPAAEPPLGFESRVLSRIAVPATAAVPAAGPARARSARRAVPGRRALTVAAVAVAIVAAGLGGWGLRGSSAGQAAVPSPLRAAELMSAGHRAVGEVFYYGAGQPWMYMTVDLPSGNGTVTCELERPGGRYVLVGAFRISGGYGSWGGDAGHGPVTGARLVGAGGAVLATASLP